MPRRTKRRMTQVRSRLAAKKATKQIVSRMITSKEEKKIFELFATTQSMNSTGIVTQLSNIIQGGAQGQRLGDKVRLHRLEFKAFIDFSVLVTSCVRVVIYRFKQNSLNFAPTAGLPLFSPTYVNTANITQAPYEWTNKKSVKVLYDTGPIVCVNSEGGNMTLRKNINMKNVQIDYNTGLVSGLNNVYLAVYGNNPIAGTFPTMDFITRMIYTDA